MSFQAYPKYRNSGVQWLGAIPETWATRRVKSLFEIKKRIAGQEGYDVLSITQRGLRIKDLESNEGQLAADYSNYQFVEPGDFAMNHMDLLTGWIDLATVQGVTSPDYRVFSPRCPAQINRRYFLHLLQTAYREKILYALGQGASQLGRWRLPREEFNDFMLPLPPLEEQDAIASALDSANGDIDALIEEQRRLIELLKEKRQAVISHAVTKGLNPDAPMKPSGVEWIGDVPSDWQLTRVKRFSTLQRGFDLTDAERTEGSYPVVTSGGISGTHGSYMVKGPGVVTGRYGSTGRLFFVEVDFWPHNTSLYVSEFHGNDVRYVWYVLQTVDFAAHSAKAAVPGVDRNDIHVLPVAVPPVHEQKRIVVHLDTTTAKLDGLIDEANRAIDLLQERRSALISAAVTGKINVATRVAKPVLSTWSTGFARQVLAAEALSRCNGPRMGRIKLQKLIHLCEYHAQLVEVRGTYSRRAAGPFSPQVMEDVREGLLQQRWFEEYKDGSRYAYRALEKVGEHKQYLSHWEDKQPRIDHVLNLLGGELTRKCEIISTLYAAWNDLLIESKNPTDAEIIHEASSAERWHESKEKIPVEKWPEALKWMRANGLVPVGYGTHTIHQSDLFTGDRVP